MDWIFSIAVFIYLATTFDIVNPSSDMYVMSQALMDPMVLTLTKNSKQILA